MKISRFIYLISSSIVFYSCYSHTLVPIEYLVPADVTFPAQIKKVGIVNNADKTPGRATEVADLDSVLRKTSNETRIAEKYVLNGDPKVTTEALAEAIAAENYFDEVVICDSALQVGGVSKQTPHLSKEEVDELTQTLGVDLIISLEEIPIQVKKEVTPVADDFLGTVEAVVAPKVNLYVSNRSNPLVMINGNDTIFWEGDLKMTLTAARKDAIPDEQLIAEASAFAGEVPLKYILPQWKSTDRYFYNNGSTEMRDAYFFVTNGDWDSAFKLWEKYYEKAKGIKKARVASNIALYYEMKDNLEKAHEWGEKALELVRIAEKIPEGKRTIVISDDYTYIRYNQNILAKRIGDFAKLKTQMSRFNDDL